MLDETEELDLYDLADLNSTKRPTASTAPEPEARVSEDAEKTVFCEFTNIAKNNDGGETSSAKD